MTGSTTIRRWPCNPVDFTNDPNVIALNKELISIKAVLGVDLQGTGQFRVHRLP